MWRDRDPETGCLGLCFRPKTSSCPWVPQYILFISYPKARFKEFLLPVTKWAFNTKEINPSKNWQQQQSECSSKFAGSHILEIFGNEVLNWKSSFISVSSHGEMGFFYQMKAVLEFLLGDWRKKRQSIHQKCFAGQGPYRNSIASP